MPSSIKIKFPKLNYNKEKLKEYRKKNLSIKDKQIAKLSKKIFFCKKCVTSNQRPRIKFDKNGVCAPCRYAEKKFGDAINWKKREKELVKLLNKHRSKDGSWDVIVPSSHGKDSAMVAHQLKEKYGMHPLTVTWAPFMYTDIGLQNFMNMTHRGFDGLVSWPNGMLHRKLARIGFEIKGDPFEAFVYGQKAYPFNIAQKFNIPLIFYGENGEVEYGGSEKNMNKSHESPADWEERYYKGFGIDKMIKEGNKMGIFDDNEIKSNKFDFYRSPPLSKIKKTGIEMHWWSYYKPWIPQENFYYTAKNTGFEANEERTLGTYTKYSSIDDEVLDSFHWYMGYIKFGLGRATREASSDIRCGHITRNEAVALVHKYDHEFPAKYLKSFIEYLDITEELFWKIINKYRSKNIWEKINSSKSRYKKYRRKVHVSNHSIYGEKPKIE